MRIELIYSPDCPHVAQARRNLMEALVLARMETNWREWSPGDAGAPAYVNGCGSPTILVDGKDIGGELLANCCRLYDGSGAPPVELLLRALEKPRGLFHKIFAGPAVGVALLPKLACPACWPAYAALVSSMGLGFLIDSQYLFWLTTLVMVVAVLALGYRAGTRHGFGPMIVGLVSGGTLLAGKFLWDLTWLSYAGVAGLMASAVWNSWPRRSRPLINIE
jgi:mercuric ion transport protein